MQNQQNETKVLEELFLMVYESLETGETVTDSLSLPVVVTGLATQSAHTANIQRMYQRTDQDNR